VPLITRKIKGQLPDDLFIRIYKDLVLEKVAASEVVFNIGDIGRKMYFIIEGEVAILIPM
jgi:CRP-like cAMP-binding protein